MDEVVVNIVAIKDEIIVQKSYIFYLLENLA